MKSAEIVKLLTLAIAPCIAIGLYIFLRDKNNKNQLELSVKSFLLGGLALLLSVMLSKVLAILYHAHNDTIAGSLLYAFVNVALVEEFSKFFFLRYYSYTRKEFLEPFDGILYSVFVAMGFAALENIMYIFIQPSYYLSVYVGSIRMVTAIPLHASVAVIMGYFVGLAKFNDSTRSYLIVGLFSATLVHGAYDYFLFRGYYFVTVIASLFCLAVAIWISFKAIQLHSELTHLHTKKQRRKAKKQSKKEK